MNIVEDQLGIVNEQLEERMKEPKESGLSSSAEN